MGCGSRRAGRVSSLNRLPHRQQRPTVSRETVRLKTLPTKNAPPRVVTSFSLRRKHRRPPREVLSRRETGRPSKEAPLNVKTSRRSTPRLHLNPFHRQHYRLRCQQPLVGAALADLDHRRSTLIGRLLSENSPRNPPHWEDGAVWVAGVRRNFKTEPFSNGMTKGGAKQQQKTASGLNLVPLRIDP